MNKREHMKPIRSQAYSARCQQNLIAMSKMSVSGLSNVFIRISSQRKKTWYENVVNDYSEILPPHNNNNNNIYL